MFSETILLTAAHVLGGIGIFLLAISMLTQGLQMISGNALQRILARWIRTPVQGLALGGVTTMLLQSSSAVTAIIIGLVNAAVLPLNHAIWVIFGANVGTTMTGWLVSATGFDFNIKAYALPFIGVGMLMKTFSRGWQGQAAGTALTGFGLFFVGVDILKDAFSAYTLAAGFEVPAQTGLLSMAALIGAGFLMTLMTQSSSAALALILTGAAGGLLSIPAGAALIIGANLGTTSTAVIAVLGASANAKRAAAAHVLFNVVTAIAALAVLPLLLLGVAYAGQVMVAPLAPVIILALFHTLFKVIGVLILSPLVPAMTRFLERRFISSSEKDGQPEFLDQTTLHMPALALGALIRELGRFRTMACENALASFTGPLTGKINAGRAAQRESLSRLSADIADFAAMLGQEKVAEDTGGTLQAALRINRYLHELSRLSANAREIRALMARLERGPVNVPEVQGFLDRCAVILDQIAKDKPLSKTAATNLKRRYNKAKDALLTAGATRKIAVDDLSALLEHLSATRRMTEQAIKAQRHLRLLQMPAERGGSGEET